MQFKKSIKKLSLILSLTSLGLSPLTASVQAAGLGTITMITEPESPGTDTFIKDVKKGLENFAKANNIQEGQDGYLILETQSEASYHSQLINASENDSDLIIVVGADRQVAAEEFAKENSDRNYLMVDSYIELANVKSVTFKDHEAAFLAGIAAASESKTKKVGFIGGMDISSVQAFESGFKAGLAEVDKQIELEVAYLNGFSEENQAQEEARKMYEANCDIIFHAAGRAGEGVFNAAFDQVASGNEDIWVIGADQDQTKKGQFELNGKNYSLTLTSTLKKVDLALESALDEINQDGFNNQHITYGVSDGIVDISKGQLSGDTLDLVDDFRQKLIDGDLNLDKLQSDSE